MIKTFTQDDLIRYIYKETSTEENLDIELALLFDETLSNQYNELKEVTNALDGAVQEPSDKTIDTILSYSKSYHLHSV